MAVVGQARSYDQKWNFRVEIEGKDVGGFVSVSGLEGEHSVVEHDEGGAMTSPSKEPGKTKFPPVTLSVGSSDNTDLYDWWLEVGDAEANSGAVGESFKKLVTIVQLERDGSEKRRYPLKRAWPSKYKPGDWDAKADENLMEEVTIVHHGFKRVNANAT
jgi:phage tail-like protein